MGIRRSASLILVLLVVAPSARAVPAFAAGKSAVSVGDTSVEESYEGSTATFTVTLSKTSAKPVSAAWSTADGTARAPSDYQAAAGKIVIAPGATSATISVSVLDDEVDEDDQTFSVVLSNLANASTADGTGVGTIIDDDQPPTIDLGFILEAPEGDAGSSTFSVPISLFRPSEKTLSFDFATTDLFDAHAGEDYVATNGHLTFVPGETRKSFGVDILGDTIDEHDQDRFGIRITNVINVCCETLGFIDILDDDASPVLTVADASVLEGNVGDSSAVFRLSLSEASGRDIVVAWDTAPGTAIENWDYRGDGFNNAYPTPRVTIPAGQTEAQFAIPVHGDTLGESDETFSVSLFTNEATLDRSSATATIRNDDGPAETLVPIGVTHPGHPDDFVWEGSTARFEIRLDHAASTPVSVSYRTVDGRAKAEEHYFVTAGTVVFQPGETVKFVDVRTGEDFVCNRDQFRDPYEFYLEIFGAVSGQIGQAQAKWRISDSGSFC